MSSQSPWFRKIWWSQLGTGGPESDPVFLSQKGIANGVPTLDTTGKVPLLQLPATAITNTFVVASQVAMLALAASTGDVAVRTDTNQSFILQGTDPTNLGDWVLLLPVTPSETDPVFVASPAGGIIAGQVTNWDTAYGWGDHSVAGYLADVVDDLTPELGGPLDTKGHCILGTDNATGVGGNLCLRGGEALDGVNPGGYVTVQSGKGDGTAPALGSPPADANPADLWLLDTNDPMGYVGFAAPVDISAAATGDGTSGVWTLPEGDGVAGQVMVTDGARVLSWDTPVAAETDPVFVASDAFGITSTAIGNWNTAFGWGNHASAGYLTSVPAGYVQTPMVEDLDVAAFVIHGSDTAVGDGDPAVIRGGDAITLGDGAVLSLQGGASRDDSGPGGYLCLKGGDGDGSAVTLPAPPAFPTAQEQWYLDIQNPPGYVGFVAPDNVGAGNTGDGTNGVFVLPEGDGAAGQVMATNGSHVLSWVTGGLENPLIADLDVGGFSIIGSPAPDTVSSGGDVEIVGGVAGTAIAAFGDSGGDVEIRSADNPSINGFVSSSEIRLIAGDAIGIGSNNGGARILIYGGEGEGNGPGGEVIIQPGKNRGGNANWLRLRGSSADASGDLAGHIEILGGSAVSPGVAGNIQVRPGDGGLNGTYGVIQIGEPTQNLVSNGDVEITGIRVDNGGGASAIGSDIVLRGGYGFVSTPASHGHIYVAPPALNNTTDAEPPTQLRFLETIANGGNFVALQAPASMGGDVIWTLPAAQQTSGQVMGIDLGEFTVVGLPSAASYPNCQALATNAAGGRTVVRSDGTNWKIVAVEGATVT